MTDSISCIQDSRRLKCKCREECPTAHNNIYANISLLEFVSCYIFPLFISFSFLTNLFMQRSGNQDNLSLGEALLKVRSLFPQSYWYWIGVGALLGYTVIFNILFTIFLSYLNRKPSHFSECNIVWSSHQR